MSFLWHGLTEEGAQVPVQVDAQGRVIAVDGTPGVSNWDRTNGVLSPAVPTDSVDIGSGNITLNASGSAEFAGGITSNDTNAIVRRGTSSSDTLAQLRFLTKSGSSNTGGSVGHDPVKNFTILSGQTTIESTGGACLGITSSGTFVVSSYTTIDTAPKVEIDGTNGSATFAGNITAPNVTFRSADPQFYVKKSKNKDALPEYVGPELDLLAEIARLEALVRHLYETLRLTPPSGWPVWDGTDDVLRQLRK